MKKLILLALAITILCALVPTASAQSFGSASETNGCVVAMYWSILQSIYHTCTVTGYLQGQGTNSIVAFAGITGSCAQSSAITQGDWFWTNGRMPGSGYVYAQVRATTDFGQLTIWQRCPVTGAACLNNPPPSVLFC